VQKARKINQSEDLSPIEVSLLDEIFQGTGCGFSRLREFV
jgi:hypothetical protein